MNTQTALVPPDITEAEKAAKHWELAARWIRDAHRPDAQGFEMNSARVQLNWWRTLRGVHLRGRKGGAR